MKENTAASYVKQPATAVFWHPRRESNSQLTLRRGLLYPFNYGGISLSEPPYFSTENQTLSIDPSPYNQGPPTHRPFAAKRLDFRPSENHLSRSNPWPAQAIAAKRPSPEGLRFFPQKKAPYPANEPPAAKARTLVSGSTKPRCQHNPAAWRHQ